MDITTLLIVWLITAVSLWLISKLPIGVEIDTPGNAVISAAVLGIITALIKPLLKVSFVIQDPATFDFLSAIFTFMIGVVCFAIAAWLVDGFRLRFGIWSAVLGAFALTIVNSVLYKLLGI